MDAVRVHVFIKGKVQGVFYRDWARTQAQSLGLTGWARNMEDGRVEATFEGKKENVEKMIKKCKEGSPMASVEHIDVIWE